MKVDFEKNRDAITAFITNKSGFLRINGTLEKSSNFLHQWFIPNDPTDIKVPVVHEDLFLAVENHLYEISDIKPEVNGFAHFHISFLKETALQRIWGHQN
jgi:hypothetical protein